MTNKYFKNENLTYMLDSHWHKKIQVHEKNNIFPIYLIQPTQTSPKPQANDNSTKTPSRRTPKYQF